MSQSMRCNCRMKVANDQLLIFENNSTQCFGVKLAAENFEFDEHNF